MLRSPAFASSLKRQSPDTPSNEILGGKRFAKYKSALPSLLDDPAPRSTLEVATVVTLVNTESNTGATYITPPSRKRQATWEPTLKHVRGNRIINHAAPFKRMRDFVKTAYDSYCESIYPPPKSVSYGDPAFMELVLGGDTILQNMRRDLQGFPRQWLPTEVQMKIHETAFMCEAPLIYGGEFYINKKIILDKNNWRAMIAILAVLTPRKFGKTWFLGQHAVVHLMNIPDHEIGVVSRTLRQAIIALATAKRLLRSHKRAAEFKITINQATKLEIVGPDGTPRVMTSYPGNPDVSTRRKKKDMISASLSLYTNSACMRGVPAS